jgi:hypothetical protein
MVHSYQWMLMWCADLAGAARRLIGSTRPLGSSGQVAGNARGTGDRLVAVLIPARVLELARIGSFGLVDDLVHREVGAEPVADLASSSAYSAASAGRSCAARTRSARLAKTHSEHDSRLMPWSYARW